MQTFFYVFRDVSHAQGPFVYKTVSNGKKTKKKRQYVSFRSKSVNGARSDTDRALRGLCSIELRTLYYSVM